MSENEDHDPARAFFVPGEREPRSLLVWSEQIRSINKANGWNVTTRADWHDTYKIPAALALIHSEVSEALEGFRAGDRENVAEELADVLIRVLDLAPAITEDFAAVVLDKMAKNAKRGFRHGGKRV